MIYDTHMKSCLELPRMIQANKCLKKLEDENEVGLINANQYVILKKKPKVVESQTEKTFTSNFTLD